MDQLRKEQFFKILEKYHTGNASKEEVEFLDAYYQVFGLRADYTSGLDEGKRLLLKNDLNSSIRKNISVYQAEKIEAGKKTVYRWSISVAAAIMIIAGAGLFYYPQKRISHPTANHITNDIAPGGNKAVLTLANGKKISLTDADNGTLAEQAGIRITKTADGQLVYEVRHLEGGRSERSLHAVEMTYNTIETPRGGQYQLILPDGSKVWLNAASSLKYPVSFASFKERKVELNGEAYFEVAKDKSHPFVVNTDKQVVEVLGTHFNINSYEDEEAVKTTLIEGSVHVFVNSGTVGKSDKIDEAAQNAGIVLKPNQQSILRGNDFNVKKVNTEESIAWKNGFFNFTHADLETVMRQLSRWYDVDVVYEGEIPPETFTGKVYRDMNLSKVLEILTYARVNFRIEGKKMIIFP